jgi:hypothetical protein
LSPSGQIKFGHDDIVLQANTDWCDQGDRYLAKMMPSSEKIYKRHSVGFSTWDFLQPFV